MTRLLTKDEEVALSRTIHGDDPVAAKAARDTLIARNMGLVHKIARRFHIDTLVHEDIVQEGCIGLIQATEEFDPERGFRFTTFAIWKIRNCIGKAMVNSGVVRQPAYRWTKKLPVPRCHLDSQTFDTEVADEIYYPEDHESEYKPDDIRRLEVALSGLLARDRHAVVCTISWGWSLRETGRNLGISGERVRQIRDEALAKLRKNMGITL